MRAPLPAPTGLRPRATTALLAVACVAALVPSGAAPAGTVRTGGLALAAPAASATDCADLLLVGLTGSGRRARADAPFGAVLEPFRDRLLARAAAGGRSVEQVHLGGRPRAVRVLTEGRRPSGPAAAAISRRSVLAWEGDLARATDRVLGRLHDAAASCPDQQVVLAGYAQGAMAVHRALGRLEPEVADRLVGAALVSDGDRTAGTSAVRLGAPAARRSSVGVHDRFFRARPDTPPVTWSVCTRGDLACHVTRRPVAEAVALHRSYATGRGAAVLEGLAGSVWSRTLRWPRPVEGWKPPAMAVSDPQAVQLPVSVHRRERDDVRFAALSGLPPGLGLSSTGRLSGTPTEVGTWTLHYTVTSARPEFDHPVPGSVELRVVEGRGRRLTAGGEHTCSLRAGDSLWCWGSNEHGQLGTGVSGTGPASPVRVGSASDWSSVVAGGAHTCGTRGTGQLFCWGLNHQGQLGLGNRTSRPAPSRVGSASDWRHLSLGWFTTCGTRSRGTLWCWGDNSAGQLGDGTNQQRRQPRRVPGSDWRSVSTGGWHTCATRADGSLWCWGRNSFGQVGDGTRVNRWNPQRIDARSSWLDVSTSLTHTCATTAAGAVRCWGRNDRGQLGDGTRADRSSPVKVAGLPRIVDLAAAEGSTCALDVDGRSWCWGSNAYGLYGDGTRTSSRVPVAGPSGQSRLTAGWLHRCATVDGSATCWGNDERGQLGDGTRSPRDAATRTDGTGDEAAEARLAGPGTTFRLATFNVLGDVHTAPYAHDDEYAPYRMRAEWSRDVLDQVGAPDVIGMQEVAPDQLGAIQRALGGQYDAWPGTDGAGNVQMSMLWRTSVWEALEKDTITIPFIDWERKAPVVRLRHRGTGQQIWVINVHNAPRDLQAQRDRAVRIETEKVRELRRSGLPVFLVGDMNEKQRVFCSVLERTDLDSPMGGSFQDGTCRPPREMRIDWIFGSPEAEWSDFSFHVSPLKTWVNDHRIAVTTVHLR
ncbi:MAG TPA: endonuclease/exonuclease/phosphatase family protein [Nocardioides sp.]|nr:endonuclease/exonuclease/phosphatase family protein [Nocardioides sp.]